MTNKQAQGRLTYLGEASKVENHEDIKNRYISYFPKSQEYFKTHDFSFYKINPVRIRYIGGFGKIYWIEKESLELKNLFGAIEEQKIVQHMNHEHVHHLKGYVRFYLGCEMTQEDQVRMCGLDQFGFDLSLNETKQRIDFKQALTNTDQARTVLVEMAKISSK